MIWLNLLALERKLANFLLTTQAAFNYLLSFIVIFIILIYFPRDSSFPFDWWDLAEFLLVLLISLLGLKKVFRVNQKGDDREFLKRFLSLSFVIALRLLITVMLIWLTYKIIMFIIPLEIFVPVDRAINHPVTELIITPVVVGIFYYFLTRSFTRINSGRYLEEVGS